jgi:hypothetical protein
MMPDMVALAWTSKGAEFSPIEVSLAAAENVRRAKLRRSAAIFASVSERVGSREDDWYSFQSKSTLLRQSLALESMLRRNEPHSVLLAW